MPNIVKTKKDESLWSRAKVKAAEQGHEKDWPYIVAIFKSMKGEKTANVNMQIAPRPRLNPQQKRQLAWGVGRGATTATSSLIGTLLLSEVFDKINKGAKAPTFGKRILRKSKYVLPLAVLMGISGMGEGILEKRLEQAAARRINETG